MTIARLFVVSAAIVLFQPKISFTASPYKCWSCLSPTSCQYCCTSNHTLSQTCSAAYRPVDNGCQVRVDAVPVMCPARNSSDGEVMTSDNKGVCCSEGQYAKNPMDNSSFYLALTIAVSMVGVVLLVILAATVYYCLRRHHVIKSCTCKVQSSCCEPEEIRLSDIETISAVKTPPSPKIIPVQLVTFLDHGAKSQIEEIGKDVKRLSVLCNYHDNLGFLEDVDPIQPIETELQSVTVEADISSAENLHFDEYESIVIADVYESIEITNRLATIREYNDLEQYLSEARRLCEEAKRTDTWNETMYTNPVFAAGLFDVEGGRLSLEKMDIELFIPPGAFSEDKEPTLVYLYVSGDQKDKPDISENRVSVSAVVHCGPSGLNFNERVILSYQHCADMESQGVHVVAMSSNSDPGDKAKYRRLDDDHSSLSIVQGNKCILHISHFTGFTSVAESSTQKQDVDIQEQTPAIKKLVDIIGFHGDLNPRVKKLPLRLYCVNKTDDAKQLVLEEEHQLRGHQADAPKTMSVVNNQRDMEFHMSEIDQSWKIGGTGPIQYVDIEAVMSSSFSACSYSMSRQDKSANAFDCTVTAFQRDNPKYDENNRLPIHFTINEPLISDPTDMAARYTLKQNPRRSLRLKYRDRLKLSHLLDPASPLGNDWRMVADKMSLSYDTIQQIERQYQSGTVLSPTREVLNYWEATKKDAAIDELLVILEDIERLDAVEFLRNVLSESKTEAQSSN